MGSLSKIFGMLPGMGEFRNEIDNIDEREIDRIQAVILSMTPAERANPKVIDGSRRARIAAGSGTQVSDVNGLVDRFFEARKMMTAVASGQGLPGMPGLPGMGRRTRSKQLAKKGKAKRGSGNPAKRAAEAKQRAVKQTTAPGEVPAAFGGSRRPQDLPADFELPKEFRNLLPPG